MFSFSKSSAVLASILLLAPAAFAQNKTVIIKYVNPKQNVRKTMQSLTRVPSKYAQVNELSEMRRMNFQNAVLDGIELGIEKKALQAVQAQRQVAQKMSDAKLSNPLTEHLPEQLQAQAEQRTEFLVQYLKAHQNVWPVYAPRSEEAYLLKRISNFMEVKNPSLDVLYIQQEIIRLRAASKARSPQEVLSIVQDMISYEMIPSRAYLSEENKHTQEELEIGEELAFAVAACKVPMQNNPWNTLQMKEVADRTVTYNAMRRADPLFEGLPTMHIEDGMYQSNFPLWTRSEFAWHQLEWVHQHPFEYALAPYWEKTFGTAFYRVYNSLSTLEKEAVLFTAPGLAQVADATAENFADYYDKALENWMTANNREPQSRVMLEQEEILGKKLTYPQEYEYTLKFRNGKREWVEFADLAYPQQLEVLLWIWKKYQIFPQKALEIIGNTHGSYSY